MQNHTLELKNISVKNGDKAVVQDISLSINSGEVHILMGPNGSGKSSLVNAIFGHPKYEISGGRVSLDGEDITTLATDKKAKEGLFLSMQYLPEIPGVSMAQFLYRADKEISGNKNTVLEFHKSLSDKADELGIDKSIISKQLNSQISGGEKKQSEILQLVALSPKFAFLDEIDSGVDIDSLKKVYSAIEKMKAEGVGFFLVSHNPNILKSVTPDFVHVMKDGMIIRSGGHEIINEIESGGFI